MYGRLKGVQFVVETENQGQRIVLSTCAPQGDSSDETLGRCSLSLSQLRETVVKLLHAACPGTSVRLSQIGPFYPAPETIEQLQQ